jgi:hypothetical protein
MMLVSLVGTAQAFYFQGYTYNETGIAVLNNTNVTILEYTMGQGGPR